MKIYLNIAVKDYNHSLNKEKVLEYLEELKISSKGVENIGENWSLLCTAINIVDSGFRKQFNIRNNFYKYDYDRKDYIITILLSSFKNLDKLINLNLYTFNVLILNN
jgi:hypothetical protein